MISYSPLFLFSNRCIAFVLMILLSPFFLALFILVKITSKGPFIYRQERVGRENKPFMLYKIRTMKIDALTNDSIRDLNEMDGPFFKIHHDPRYTKIGNTLAHTGLDELAQLWNIVNGDMVFVGPRPLPYEEYNKLPKRFQSRSLALPGVFSVRYCSTPPLRYQAWMESDINYIHRRSCTGDGKILLRVLLEIAKNLTKL